MFKDVKSIEELVEASKAGTVIVLKHSTACNVSAVAMSQVEKFLGKHAEKVDSYLVVVQKDRAISDEIERHFDVRHQSPQLLIIKGGEVTKKWSHFTIQASAIAKELDL